MDAREMDRLVDVIANRVKSRLGGVAAPSDDGRPGGTCCGQCQFDACGSCGINPVNAEGQCLNQQGACAAPKVVPKPREMAQYIDHTLLKATASRADIEELCAEAREHSFWSVCVNSGNVRLAAAYLTGSPVKVCAVVGFPLGAGTPGAKAYETREAIRCGASEIDMVLNIGALKSGDYRLVEEDIRKVVAAAPGKVVKVIFETAMLDDNQKIIASALSKVAGASYVKTSTGFGPGGATVEDVALMRAVVGPDMGVKASGGVRTYEDAVKMIGAGANRLGCSSSVQVVTGKGGNGGGGY
jgi:deoxyribose-phosphate aldolase